MNLDNILHSFYNRAHDFATEANKILPSDNKIFFSGEIFSGVFHNPDVLFLSINPGFGNDAWKN